jgi:co-chaperonin GroES (HSP10)
VKVALLRGRIAIRPIVEKSSGLIHFPEDHQDWTRKLNRADGVKAQTSHFGTVLGMGPPAIGAHGHEVPHDFKIGDVVNFTYQMSEKWSDGHVWDDGQPCIFIAQEHIQGVLE